MYYFYVLNTVLFSRLVNNRMHSQRCSAQHTALGAPRTLDFSTLCKRAPGGAPFCPPGPTSLHPTIRMPHLIWLFYSLIDQVRKYVIFFMSQPSSSASISTNGRNTINVTDSRQFNRFKCYRQSPSLMMF